MKFRLWTKSCVGTINEMSSMFGSIQWNGLPNHIRESNSIATFKRNVLSFIKDN